MAGSPRISGIICTHNRERFLQRCVMSLLDQSLAPEIFEIIVVDNASSDGTRRICEEFSNLPNFTYIYEPVIGLSSARNAGWKAACSSYVGYIDDDATADHGWFEKALWSFENICPVPEWVGGPIDLEWEVKEPNWITEEDRVPLGKVDWGGEARFLTEKHERLGGGNSFYRRDVLENMNGFDTRLGRKKNLLLSGEETQFQHRLRALGGRLFYHPDVRIHHFVPRERTQPVFFYKRHFWGGRTDHIMSRTLKSVVYEPIAQQKQKASSVGRLVRSCMGSLGLSVSKKEKIHSRIYLCYVVGWVVQSILSGLRPTCRDDT